MRLLALIGVLSALCMAKADDRPEDFTALDVLVTPRPGAAIATPDGAYALSTVDTWIQESDTNNRLVWILSLNTPADPILLYNGTTDIGGFWYLDADTTVYGNGSSLYTFSLSETIKNAGKNGAVLKGKQLIDFPDYMDASGYHYDSKTNSLVFSATIWGNGDFEANIAGESAYKNRSSSGLVYDELYVRHWDTWRIPGKVHTLGYTRLWKGKDGYYVDKKPKFVNLLKGTNYTEPMDAHESFDVGNGLLAFQVKAPWLNQARHTRQDVYIMPIPSDDSEPIQKPVHLTPNDHGAVAVVKISPDGKKVGWLEQAIDGYESDRKVVVIHELAERGAGASTRWTDTWDRSPTQLEFSKDSQSVFVVAENHGRNLPYYIGEPGHLPTPLVFEHYTSHLTVLPGDRVLLAISSIISPLDEYILDLSGSGTDLQPGELRQLTWHAKSSIHGRLDSYKLEEEWFKGANGWDVMAFIIKPRGWSEADNEAKKKYPMAFLVHGGPQGAWSDAWNTRWNPVLFAASGYFVVSVNPTGSTGYGQEFVDKIKGDWGGAPFKDLLAGYQYILDKYPAIDPARTAMLGASYGGYMANWIQGHNDQFGFKAIVCHDGIYNTAATFYETEELYFPFHEFEGDPVQTRALYEKWNPMNHISEWKTPQLIIHGGKDYRLPDTQGIGAFTALQVNGVPSRFLYFPDENHWTLKAANSLKWEQTVFGWIDQWTGTNGTSWA